MRDIVDFLLFDWLRVDMLTQHGRFADHSTQTFSSVLDLCELLSAAEFAPHNRPVDREEPRFDAGRVQLPPQTRNALIRYAESGMLAATQDVEAGGMQLPFVVEMAASAFFYHASIGIANYAVLTTANANLLMAHGTPAQQQVFAARQLAGDWFGTMCLSEPQAGSSLSDIATRAVPDGADHADDPLGPRYRVSGSKMWISGGDHEITENIVHLVLAKVPGPDGKTGRGTSHISLFIVPKMRVDAQGRLTGECNDVALAGLNHKLGHRGTTNCLLNFGDNEGAIGYRVGREGQGLQTMFHMMNEARIRVGLGATALGLAGYEASVTYARTRLQGRRTGSAGKAPGAASVPIIEHTDVRRMLLAQRAYTYGALALQLYCSRLVDARHAAAPDDAREAARLLELLTPIAKSWPSEWCLEANSLAIQVHGGYGYTRDFAVEQHWRDNRLNMIHEGTHGVQAMDLLGRKVRMDGGEPLRALLRRIAATVDQAGGMDGWATHARQLAIAAQRLDEATQACWQSGQLEHALRNAVPYLQAFGHVVLAWLWLDIIACLHGRDDAFAQGNRYAMRWFFGHELPKALVWLDLVEDGDATCQQAPQDCF